MAIAGRPFVGRLAVVDALKRRLHAAAGGRGGLTLLEGEPGVGKTTLLESLLPEARSAGLHVLVGRAPSLANPPPYLLLRSALESVAGEDRRGDVRDDPSSLAFAAPAGGSGPALLGFAPGADRGTDYDVGLVGERLLDQLGDPGTNGLAETGRASAELARRLLSLAARGPAVLVLDDVHLADEPSLSVLRGVAPELDDHALWVLATSLPTGSLPEDRRETLEEILGIGHGERLGVPPLTPPEIGEFARGVDPSRDVTDDEVVLWHSQTGGNPLFLEQLLRQPTGGGPSRPVLVPPPSPTPEFAEILHRQLTDLSEVERRVLTVGAILGREFPFALLERATGEEEEPLTEIVQSLVHRGILRESAAEEIVFVREELRVQLEGSMTEAHRRLVHRKAAEALEAMGTPDEATVYALARHYDFARVEAKAAFFNRVAGRLAARALAPSVARVHLERALDNQRRLAPRDPIAEIDLTLDLAVQLDRLGELAPAEALLRQAALSADRDGAPPEERALVTAYLARILVNEGQWEEAERLTSDLLLGPTPPALPLTLMALHRLRGEMFYFLGRYDESLAHHDRALELARAQRNEREVAREMVRRANVLGMISGRLDEAIEAYHIASRSLITLGDKGEASNALLYLGVVLAQHGRLAEAVGQLGDAARFAEEAHEPRRLGWALFNIADVDREMGEVARAREPNRRAREILQGVGDRFGLLQTHIVEGKLLLATGDLSGAEVELLEAYRLVRELRTPADELEVILRLAELAEHRGDLAAARRRLEELPAARVGRLRPDLVPDLDRLRGRLGPGAAEPTGST